MNDLFGKELPISNTFRDKRHLLILVAITQLLLSYSSATLLCGRSRKIGD